MDMKIRDEESKDIEQVRAILEATFPTEAESKLVDALRTNGKAIISLVVVRDDQVLGHILFSPVSTTPPSEPKGIGLAPVAVRPDVQPQGIGSGLIREGLRLCKELGYDYVDDEFRLIRFSRRELARGLVRYESEFALFSV